MRVFVFVLFLSLFQSGTALAGLPVEVTDALNGAKVDASTIGALIFFVFIAIQAMKYLQSSVEYKRDIAFMKQFGQQRHKSYSRSGGTRRGSRRRRR